MGHAFRACAQCGFAHGVLAICGLFGAAVSTTWLVLNGDADGICAAHQLRLAGLDAGQVVTGVKRDIALLERVDAQAGDHVVVADISLDANRAALARALTAGARVTWYDHHHAGEVPATAALEAHIDTASDMCTSIIVDAQLGGRFRPWAIVAAFGDNLVEVGQALGRACGIGDTPLAALRELGELMNYNAYGENVADLHVAPAALFARLAEYGDPAEFIASGNFVPQLRAGMATDLARARGVAPLAEDTVGAIVVLPAADWARRVNGVFANQLAGEHPERAHAVLVTIDKGYLVSVRAPLARPTGADALCRRFATGGGRARAAGSNRLAHADLGRFCTLFREHFAAPRAAG